ncbi:Putative ribosomal protein L47 [Acrodontium crateriforme]|uniref:Large ribosomal subunit protein uL29m n=1 Tax=Acrodontium crateriforme TaxID=150365 RepID=A0AAQ3M0W7_9PEZI|nr:Putative ribosomal protein L47 [Acrodontium crateriforme]
MAPPNMHCTCRTLLSKTFTSSAVRPATLPPSFLIPAFVNGSQSNSFSTTTPAAARKDGNVNRGVSALYRSGLGRKQKLSVKLSDLPKPVLDPASHPKVEVTDDHGLWQFFPSDKSTMLTPQNQDAHGRGWTVEELRTKDWNDLHKLWWVCIKERNRIDTGEMERKRVNPQMYGQYEADNRTKEIKITQRHIKLVLTERYYAWENARYAAMDDPEINMYANLEKGESVYTPSQVEQSLPDSSVPEGASSIANGEARV